MGYFFIWLGDGVDLELRDYYVHSYRNACFFSFFFGMAAPMSTYFGFYVPLRQFWSQLVEKAQNEGKDMESV
jgi:hypothetical protein